MKKVATLLAALMLMTAAFAGCGDTGSNSSAAETSTSSTVSETSASESESSSEAAGDETSSEASAAETGDYGEFTTVEEGTRDLVSPSSPLTSWSPTARASRHRL